MKANTWPTWRESWWKLCLPIDSNRHLPPTKLPPDKFPGKFLIIRFVERGEREIVGQILLVWTVVWIYGWWSIRCIFVQKLGFSEGLIDDWIWLGMRFGKTKDVHNSLVSFLVIWRILGASISVYQGRRIRLRLCFWSKSKKYASWSCKRKYWT